MRDGLLFWLVACRPVMVQEVDSAKREQENRRVYHQQVRWRLR